jgi:hypothetical protein
VVRRPLFVVLFAVALAVPACGGGCPPVSTSTPPDDSTTVTLTPVDTPTDEPTDSPTDQPTDEPTDGPDSARRQTCARPRSTCRHTQSLVRVSYRR